MKNVFYRLNDDVLILARVYNVCVDVRSALYKHILMYMYIDLLCIGYVSIVKIYRMPIGRTLIMIVIISGIYTAVSS